MHVLGDASLKLGPVITPCHRSWLLEWTRPCVGNSRRHWWRRGLSWCSVQMVFTFTNPARKRSCIRGVQNWVCWWDPHLWHGWPQIGWIQFGVCDCLISTWCIMTLHVQSNTACAEQHCKPAVSSSSKQQCVLGVASFGVYFASIVAMEFSPCCIANEVWGSCICACTSAFWSVTMQYRMCHVTLAWFHFVMRSLYMHALSPFQYADCAWHRAHDHQWITTTCKSTEATTSRVSVSTTMVCFLIHLWRTHFCHEVFIFHKM